jgi:hypothetical protein
MSDLMLATMAQDHHYEETSGRSCYNFCEQIVRLL